MCIFAAVQQLNALFTASDSKRRVISLNSFHSCTPAFSLQPYRAVSFAANASNHKCAVLPLNAIDCCRS